MVDEAKPSAPAADAPETGDDRNMKLWLLLLGISAGGMGITELGDQLVKQPMLLEDMAPTAAYLDLIMNSPSSVLVTQIAKDYGYSAVLSLLQDRTPMLAKIVFFPVCKTIF